jgi:hypothetical protein
MGGERERETERERARENKQKGGGLGGTRKHMQEFAHMLVFKQLGIRSVRGGGGRGGGGEDRRWRRRRQIRSKRGEEDGV